MHKSLDQLEKEFSDLASMIKTNLPIPPPCFATMKAEFIEYESRKSLTVAFPVLPEHLNPGGTMQGGFITAAFDNVFGPLSYLAARGVCTSIDIHTQFVRGIEAGDTLTVTATVVSRGTGTTYMTGEARNSARKLVATASTNLLIVSKKEASGDLTRTR